MMRHVLLSLTLIRAMLLACTGVVLAQQAEDRTTSGSEEEQRGGGTTTKSGTSMASPHGAGGGALYLFSNTGASPSMVESNLKSTATDTGKTSKDGRKIMREYVKSY
jgi:subtilisin family serine protease